LNLAMILVIWIPFSRGALGRSALGYLVWFTEYDFITLAGDQDTCALSARVSHLLQDMEAQASGEQQCRDVPCIRNYSFEWTSIEPFHISIASECLFR
jgi:hypothetical protein